MVMVYDSRIACDGAKDVILDCKLKETSELDSGVDGNDDGMDLFLLILMDGMLDYTTTTFAAEGPLFYLTVFF